MKYNLQTVRAYLLGKLETEYAGRFKLVKIDSDQEQELSQAFGIRSIPTCVLIMGGKDECY